MIDLSKFTTEELRKLADTLGLKPHHKASDETVINQIMQQPMSRIEAAINGKVEKPVVVASVNTKEQVLESIKKFTEKEGFSASFNDKDNTWHFKCRGAEDSGNLSIPLKVIVTKADMVSKGAKRLLAHDPTNFDPGNSQGKNAYTNNVLRV